MKIKSKSLDGINEITYDTETGATTTTLLHTINFEKYKKWYGGESEIFKRLLEELKKGTFSDCDEEFQYCCYEIISNLQQENQKYKEALSKLNEMNADNYNKYCEELKKNVELKKQLNELKEIEKDHQRLNGELREELKKCI